MTTQNTNKQLFGQIKPGDKEIDDTVTHHVNTLRDEIESTLAKSYTTFILLKYKSQVVSGINYFIKIQVKEDSNECIHVRIYKDLQNNLSLHSIVENKTINDNIEWF
jgi:cystatin-A/B